MRAIRTSGSMSGMWKRSMVRLVRHRQTKGPATDRLHLNHRATSRLYVRRGNALVHSGYKSHPGTGSLRPVAIEATVEVTKPSEPSVKRVAWRLGERAGRNVSECQQAPKRVMQTPTRLRNGEGRRRWDSTSEQVSSSLPG